MRWFRHRRVFDSASQVTARTGDRWLDSLLSRVDATLDEPTDELASTVLAQRVCELADRRSHMRLDDQRPPERSLSGDTKVVSPSRSSVTKVAAMGYRTQDGLADYGFSIEFQSDVGWRVYIIFQPYQGHGDSLKLPYQSIDRDGRPYVNWSAKIDSLGDARTVAALWAELTQRYHRTQEENALWAELTPGLANIQPRHGRVRRGEGG